MNQRSIQAYVEQQDPTRSEKIAENRMVMQAAGEHYLRFATGILGSYRLIRSLAANDRKIDARTISIEENGADLFVSSKGGTLFFPFQWLFHDASACPFPDSQLGQEMRELHSFIRDVISSEIDSICATSAVASPLVLPITYFKIGGENGFFHMKDGRHGCVIQQYEWNDRKYLKIVSLEPKHSLARAGVIAGTYIRVESFKGVEIPGDFQKMRGEKRIEQMLAFRDFVAHRMEGRKALPIPAKVKEEKVEDRKIPLFSLATKDGELVKPAHPLQEVGGSEGNQPEHTKAKKNIEYPQLNHIAEIRSVPCGQINRDGLTILVCSGGRGTTVIRLRNVPKEHGMRKVADRSFAVFQSQLLYSDDHGPCNYMGDDLLRYRLRQYVRGLLIREGVELRAPTPASMAA